MSEHLTLAEWDALGRRGQETVPENRMALVFLGSLVEEVSPAGKARFLVRMPLPIRVVRRIFGAGVCQKARDRVRVG